MKNLFFLTKIALIFALVVVFTGCEEEEVQKDWGEVTTGFSIDEQDQLFAPAEVVFINQTKNAEGYHWVFPQGRIIQDDQITTDSTTTEIQPQAVYYSLPGEYEAILTVTVDGEETEIVEEFTVKKPQPKIVYQPEGGIVFDDTIQFSAEYFIYPDLQDQVTYQWDFGNGETSTEPTPITSYNPPGEYTVSLELFDGVETLYATLDLTIQAEIAKTLFFTDAINQTLYKKMLYQGTDLPHENLNVDVGLHPLAVSVHKERIVINVAGDNIVFSDNEDTPPDGYIFSTNLNGGDRYTITAPTADHDYRDDPFAGTIGPDGTVYWVDRFNGARRININEQDAEYPDPYVFHEAAEGTPLAEALGVSTAYGWTDGNVRIVNGELWYSKHGTGRGLYRFTTEGEFLGKFDNLFDLKIKAFEVDTVNQKIYLSINNSSGGYDPGLYVCDIDGNNIQLIDPLENYSMQGGETERTFISDLVLDIEGGYVYYPFRHDADINDSGEIVGDGSLSGIKRWKIDGSEDPEFYVTGVIPYGMGIDHVKR